MTLFSWWLAVVLPLVAASGFVRAALKGANPLERILATLAGAAVVVLVVILPLGLAGWLSPLPCLAFAGALAVCGFLVGVRAERGESRPANWLPTDIVATVGMAVATGLVTVVFGRQLRGGTAYSFDDLTYHAAVVAHWVRDGAFSLTPFNYHAHYPFNAESLSLWFVLPTRSDAWAGLAGLTWVAVAALAVAAVSRRLGASPGASAAVAALAAATPAVIDQARTFSAVDLACSASIMAALSVFLVGGRRIPISHCAWVGAFAGYAAGCKPSFLPYPILFAFAALFLADEARRRLLRASTVALAAAVTGSFWYLRNLFLTGNPLFPASVGPFDGPLGRAEQTRTTVSWWIHSGDLGLGEWIELVRAHLNWPISLAVLVAAGYLWAATAGRSPKSELPRFGLLLVLVIGLFALATYPFMPFAGAANAPDPPMRFSQRFLLLPLLIGLALSGPLEKTKRWRPAWWACAVLAGLTAWRGDGIDAGFALLGTGAAAVAAATHYWKTNPWKTAGTVGLIAGLLAVATPIVQRATDLRIFQHGGAAHPVGSGWQRLESLPAETRVVGFGPQTYQYYPIFGRRYQLQPVRVASDGGRAYSLSERWARGERSGWWSTRPEITLEPAEFCRNLGDVNVDVAFVSRWRGPDWPPQHAALSECSEAQEIWSDGYSAIFRIGEVVPSPSSSRVRYVR